MSSVFYIFSFAHAIPMRPERPNKALEPTPITLGGFRCGLTRLPAISQCRPVHLDTEFYRLAKVIGGVAQLLVVRHH